MTFPSRRPAVWPAVCPFLVKVFLFANISVSIHRIAFIFYIQLPKDIGNTVLWRSGNTADYRAEGPGFDPRSGPVE